MDCEAVIFDLDGTLLDTLADIADAANRVLDSHGHPTHPHQAYKWFVGDGSRRLMTRALPEKQRQPQIIEACLEGFIADYRRNWDKATRPYDGIMELLQVLQKKGIKLSVVTNKPHQFAASMMRHYFKDAPFAPIFGQRDGIPKKPDPRQALAAAQEMGVKPASCIFLGDSAVDMQTAHQAGMYPVGAGWGFRPFGELVAARAARVLNHPLEMRQLIQA
jgi:phosphoglycolate phosphatase